MTVLTETARASFAWTGAETAFACGFPADKVADLQVFYTNALGVQQQLTLGVHFSATLASSTKLATVMPIALPAAPGTLVVQRKTPSLVTETLADGQEFSLAVLQRMFDRLAMSGAEFRTALARAIVLAEGADPGTGTFDLLGSGIRNMAAATLPNDAVTLAQLQAVVAADGNVPVPGALQEGLPLLALAGGLFGWGQLGQGALLDGILSADAAGRTKMADRFVTLAKMADLSTATFIGRLSAGSGVPEALSATDARTILKQWGPVIADQTLTAAATAFADIDITAYGEFEFMLTAAPNAAAADFALAASMSFDGGATFPAGASEYTRVIQNANSAAVSSAVGNGSTILISGTIDTANTAIHGEARGTFRKGSASHRCYLESQSLAFDGANLNKAHFDNIRTSNGQATHIRFSASAANGLGAGSRLIVTGRP